MERKFFLQFLFTSKKGFSDIVDFCKEFSINTSVSFMVERIIPELKQFFFFTNIMEWVFLYFMLSLISSINCLTVKG